MGASFPNRLRLAPSPDREGITQHAKFGSDRYSKEELVAELGAAFLSNEAGILDGVRFENSAAYLASWVIEV